MSKPSSEGPSGLASGQLSDRCADRSADRDEPLVGTASRVHRWLLVEHRGSWGAAAPPTSRLPKAVAAHLGVLAGRQGARLLMVRRPVKDSTPGRWVFAVTSTPGREQVLSRHVDYDEELLHLADPLEDGDGWTRESDRFWVVCTHGSHDACCAVRGQPVAKAMRAVDSDRVWEASHVGGDRFAANVILLPEGHYFGRVTPDGAQALMAGVEQGRLDVGTWRGRSSLPTPTQAAQAFARQHTGQDGLDDLALVEQRDDGPDQWRVRLTGGVEVVVRYDRGVPPELLTCDADLPKSAARFVCEDVDLRSG
jgi:hypothetical protein